MVSHARTNGNTQIARPFQTVQPGVPLGKDLRRILESDYPPTRWLIPDILPWGFTLFSAAPKSGKSMVATWITLKIATTPAQEGQLPPSVLYISPDDTDEGGIQERTNMMLGGIPIDSGRVTMWFHDVERLDGGLLLQIGAYLEQHPECVLVVIDVYNSVKPERKIDDIQRHDHSAMHEMREFGQRTGVAILLLHHTTTRPKRRFQQGAGSNGLGGGVQGILELERDEFGEMVTLYRRTRRCADASFRFSLNDLGVDFTPTPQDAPPDDMTTEQLQEEADAAAREREEEERRKRPHVPGPIERKLLAALADGERWTPKALAEAASIRHTTARVTLWRMQQRGSVTLMRYGVYQLPRVTSNSVTLPALPRLAASEQAPRVTRVTVTLPADISPPPKEGYFPARVQRYIAQGIKPKKAEELALAELKAELQT